MYIVYNNMTYRNKAYRINLMIMLFDENNVMYIMTLCHSVHVWSPDYSKIGSSIHVYYYNIFYDG